MPPRIRPLGCDLAAWTALSRCHSCRASCLRLTKYCLSLKELLFYSQPNCYLALFHFPGPTISEDSRGPARFARRSSQRLPGAGALRAQRPPERLSIKQKKNMILLVLSSIFLCCFINVCPNLSCFIIIVAFEHNRCFELINVACVGIIKQNSRLFIAPFYL